MKKQWLALIVVLAALMMLVIPAAAQENDLNCVGLSADDCQIVTDAIAQTEELQSFTQSYSFELSITGGDAMGMSAVSIQSEGSGPFVAMPDGDAMAPFNMGLDMTGSISGTGDDMSGSFSMAVVDGIVYFQNPETGTWGGVKAEDLFAVLAEQMGSMMGGTMGGGSSSSSPEEMLNNPAVGQLAMAAMTFDPFAIDGFISQARGDDAELDGQTMYAFTHTFDVDALLTSPEFQELVSAGSTAAMEASPDAAQMAMLAPMFAQMVSGEVTFTRWIGADDGFAHRLVVAADVNLDLSAMMAGSSSSDAPEMPPINLSLNLTVDLTNINDTASPVAPEGATIRTRDEMMNMGG